MIKQTIPVIDIGPFRNGPIEARRNVVRQVGAACEDLGFLIIQNHGLPGELLADAFSVSREFFARPLEAKLRLSPPEPAMPRGYMAYASKNLGRTLGLDTPPDLREQFFIGPLAPDRGRIATLPKAAPFYAENFWPDAPVIYRSILSALYQEMETLAAAVMRIFALALDQPEEFFEDRIDNHFSTLPTNFYPALEEEPLPEQIRAGPHTDFGSLTVLAIEGAAGGLQVKFSDGSWHDVVPPPGALVINLGDMMARWTNDRWRSTLHRVVNPSAEPDNIGRQSLGYFLHPNYDAEVACLASCTGPDNPPRYQPILAGEHMREKLERRVA